MENFEERGDKVLSSRKHSFVRSAVGNVYFTLWTFCILVVNCSSLQRGLFD